MRGRFGKGKLLFQSAQLLLSNKRTPELLQTGHRHEAAFPNQKKEHLRDLGSLITRPCCPQLWLCQWRPCTCNCPPSHSSDSQSYSFSRAHPLASVFSRREREPCRSPQTCPAWRKNDAGPSRKQSHPGSARRAQHAHTECCGCSFLCVPTAPCSDQSTGRKLEGYPALGPDLLCNLGHPSLHSDWVTYSANRR